MSWQYRPDLQPGLRIAAASNAMAGRPEQAHKAVARLRLLNPTLRVSTLKDVLGPFRRAEDLSRYEEVLRQAGLPEGPSQPWCPQHADELRARLPLKSLAVSCR